MPVLVIGQGRRAKSYESPYRYLEEQFIKGNNFATMEELNRRGKEFVEKWCNEIHGTTKRIPNQHYLLEEKAVLLPLPKKRYKFKQMEKRIVSSDSFVSINGCKYSVPVKYVGKTLQFRITYGFRIELYDMKENLVLKIEVSSKKHDIVVDQDHYAEIAVPISTSIPQICIYCWHRIILSFLK